METPCSSLLLYDVCSFFKRESFSFENIAMFVFPSCDFFLNETEKNVLLRNNFSSIIRLYTTVLYTVDPLFLFVNHLKSIRIIYTYISKKNPNLHFKNYKTMNSLFKTFIRISIFLLLLKNEKVKLSFYNFYLPRKKSQSNTIIKS